MRHLTFAETNFVAGADGLSVCTPLPPKLAVLCNILAGDLIANAVVGTLNVVAKAIDAGAVENPLPPTIYAPGYGPPDGNPYSNNFVGPPAPLPDLPDEIYGDEGE